jgi:hypothetical protein
METDPVAGVRIAAAEAVALAKEVVALALVFLLLGGATFSICEAARSKAFRFRVVGAVVV